MDSTGEGRVYIDGTEIPKRAGLVDSNTIVTTMSRTINYQGKSHWRKNFFV